MSYVIQYTDGRADSHVASYEDARTLVSDRWQDAEIGHDGDLESGGDRTLVWACEADSVDDDGARAVASIRRVED